MEKLGHKTEKLEINAQEILGIIDDLKMNGSSGGYEPFEYQGIKFLLIMTDILSESYDFSIASYSASTANPGGWDIYLYEKASPANKRRAMFHEIAEIILAQKYSLETGSAHKLALQEEEKNFGKR